MPKAIELTVQLLIQRVSCPGVWLCQDGCVSLTVYTLGTKHETSALAPVFPLGYNESFHFSKMYLKNNSMSSICNAMRDETIYCELVQWSKSCNFQECVILAQYLGALNDILFVPSTCSDDGVDLLMRRTSEFPGILAPKIEMMTKVRIDEVVVKGDTSELGVQDSFFFNDCKRKMEKKDRQKPVCHTPDYHRLRCSSRSHTPQRVASRSPSRCSRSRSCKQSLSKFKLASSVDFQPPSEKLFIESRFIPSPTFVYSSSLYDKYDSKISEYRLSDPCACDICTRYHEMFNV